MANASPAATAATPDYTTLAQCLLAETTEIKHFISLLQKEAAILADGAPINKLEALTAQKNQHAETLAKQAQQRNQILGAMGLGTDRAGLLAAAGDHSQLLEAVHALLDGTEQARLLNLGNGQIIDRFLRHHGQALQVLHHLTGRSQLYDARGRTRPTQTPRTGHNKSA